MARDRWSTVIGLWQNLVVHQLLKRQRSFMGLEKVIELFWVKANNRMSNQLKKNKKKTCFCYSLVALIKYLSPPMILLGASQPEVRRWLTFLSVAQRLSLSPNVQTQVSSLHSHTTDTQMRMGVEAEVLVRLHQGSNQNVKKAHLSILHIQLYRLVFHKQTDFECIITSFQAIGSVLKSELVSSTERRFL